MSASTITPQKLYEISQGGQTVDLVDVRTPVEFREIHVPFAKNIPLDQLNSAKVTATCQESSAHVYVICRSGKRGEQACEKLTTWGFSNVVNVEGGTLAWKEAGLPVVQGKKAISLERQVRIAAGSLVLIGVVLSQLHPYWIGLSGFVGAGLVFAGITDTCGMGLILAKMPWNHVSSAACTTPR